MKAYWLHKQEDKGGFLWFKPKPQKKDLLIFFAGWSFDYNSFCCESEKYDILMIYDYNDLSLPQELEHLPLEDYQNKYLIAWSMGVYIAYKFRNLFKNFDKKVAVNGTVTPIDDNFGIPEKVFNLTLKHAAKGLEGKFYQNLFNNNEKDLEIFNIEPIERSIENRVSELENLYSLIKNEKEPEYESFYDYAVVGMEDKIIPPNNQIASHKKNNIRVITVPYGHFLFYGYMFYDFINEYVL